jgi:uncharacterized protein
MPNRKSASNANAIEMTPIVDRKTTYEVRNSAIHGRGIFALRNIKKGERLIEYTGTVISEKEADKLYGDAQSTGAQNHTFLFSLSNGNVIDATKGSYTAKWINHGCDPNCETIEDDDRVFIEAKRAIKAGEELKYDYHITLEERHTPAAKARFKCLCGAKNCRGTLLAKKK